MLQTNRSNNGAKRGIAGVVLSIVNPGDLVILPAPFWVSYAEIVKLAKGSSAILPAGIRSDYKTKPEIAEAITDKLAWYSLRRVTLQVLYTLLS